MVAKSIAKNLLFIHVKDGAKTISGCHERFIFEKTKPCSQLRRQEYVSRQDSSEKGRVETAMKRFAIEESR